LTKYLFYFEMIYSILEWSYCQRTSNKCGLLYGIWFFVK